MALKMVGECEKCESTLKMDDHAYICSYECTFCADCTEEFKNICPNCAGELVLRPRRKDASQN